MINYQLLGLPIHVCDEHQVLIDEAFKNMPESEDVIHDYYGLVGFIEGAESFLENQLSDSDINPITVTCTNDFEIKANRHSRKIQYWIYEIDFAYKQGKWHMVNIRCEQVSKKTMDERMRRLLD